MQLLCPHCHNPIEAVALDLAHEILCPSCGSTFRLDMGSTVTWPPSEGPGTLRPYGVGRDGRHGRARLGVQGPRPRARSHGGDQEHGVVHREIKPSNILLDEQGKPQQPVL